MAALLADRVMCGAAPTPAQLGIDPCRGRDNGQLAPWKTRDGRTKLTWVAALPMYTFGDLIQVLAPNGRGTDGWKLAPPDGNHSTPFGVPLQSTVSGLIAAAPLSGSLRPRVPTLIATSRPRPNGSSQGTHSLPRTRRLPPECGPTASSSHQSRSPRRVAYRSSGSRASPMRCSRHPKHCRS